MRFAVLNGGSGAWAFAELAERLAAAMWLPVVEEPADVNYVLYADAPPVEIGSFVPLESINIAGDKRLQAELFRDAGVATSPYEPNVSGC